MPTVNDRRRNRRTRGYSALLASALLVVPMLANAQVCPNATISVGGLNAGVYSYPSASPDPDELYDFIGPGGCTTVAFGPNPPTDCGVFRFPATAALVAQWSNAAFNTTMNGCIFNCDGGTCRVQGGDGLPVELMDFSIESSTAEKEDTSSTDDAE